MSVFAQLKAILGLDTSAYKAGMKDATGATKGFQSTVASAGRVIAGAFSVGAVIAMGKSFVSWADKASTAAKNAGVLTSDMLALNEAALKSGLGIEDMQKLLTTMQNTLYDAAGGNETAIAAFEGLGLSIEDLASKDPAAMLVAVAEAAAQSATPLEDVSKLFGEKLGPNAMSALMDIAENGLPAVDTAIGDTADRVEALGDKWTAMGEKAKRGLAIAIDWLDKTVGRAAAFVGGVVGGGSLTAGFDEMANYDTRRADEQKQRTEARRQAQRRSSDELLRTIKETQARESTKSTTDAASKASALRDKYASKRDSILGSRRIDGGAGVRADSMAQVGGFVGGGRGALGIADRQLKMQTESNRIQTEIIELNRQMNEALQEIRASNGGTFQGSV